jgi:hypothetical protein
MQRTPPPPRACAFCHGGLALVAAAAAAAAAGGLHGSVSYQFLSYHWGLQLGRRCRRLLLLLLLLLLLRLWLELQRRLPEGTCLSWHMPTRLLRKQAVAAAATR